MLRRPAPALVSRPLPALASIAGTVCLLSACADESAIAKPSIAFVAPSGSESIHVSVHLEAPPPPATAVLVAPQPPVVYVRPAYTEPMRPVHVVFPPTIPIINVPVRPVILPQPQPPIQHVRGGVAAVTHDAID
jgi:hypothetical protein